MFRKELLLLGVVATLVFLSVAGMAAWMTRTVAHDARMLALDTLPGLVNAGEALNVMDQNWEKITSLTAVPTVQARSNVIQEIQGRTTQEFWSNYEQSIYDPTDRQLFAKVQAARAECRQLTQQFFDLVNNQRLEESRQLLAGRLTPAFSAYRSEVVKLFQMNKAFGEQRAERIRAISRWLPLAAGLSSIVVFGLGFLLGLRGAFTGLELVFRRSAKR